MDQPCSREDLRACLRDIARTNQLTFAYRPLLRWLRSVIVSMPPLEAPLRILDVGCGYGDGLRRIERWAERNHVPVELTGLDLNPDASAIASEATPVGSRILWITGDALAYSPAQSPHLILSSLFTHHLVEDQIIEFLKWMETHALLGWFVNDLSRAAVPYYGFRAFSKLAGLHPFVKHDGPVSIQRAFVASEWQSMLEAAGLAVGSIEIQPF